MTGSPTPSLGGEGVAVAGLLSEAEALALWGEGIDAARALADRDCGALQSEMRKASAAHLRATVNARITEATAELLAALKVVCAVLDKNHTPNSHGSIFDDPCELVNDLEKEGVHELVTAAIADATGAS